MSAERKPDLHLEIAHVLFIDVVGYSKLLADEQSERLQLLNQIVRGSAEFRTAEEKGELIRLPTGDGMALVFLTKPEAPVQCALEISKAIKSYPELQLRMGIHSGSVNQMRDVNDRSNVTGAGINIAQRVMDCGDAGHILVSQRVAEDLGQYRLWQPRLHDLGECEVKHGVRVHVFNLYTDEVGNRAVPAKLKPIAPEPPPSTALPKTNLWVWRWLMWGCVVAAGLLALLLVVIILQRRSPPGPQRNVPSPVPTVTGAPTVALPQSTSTSPKMSPSSPAPAEIGEPLDLPALAQQTRGAVVLIVGYDAAGKIIKTGSGFFVSADGRLVTNYHVIEGIVNAQAKLESGAIYNIDGILVSSSALDLAVLKADARDMQFLLVDNASNPPQPGTRIAVIGSPLALVGSLSEGIVSAIRSRPDGSWLVQISAPISPGSSGSPVLGRNGRVVGVASMAAEKGQNLNFARSSYDLWNFLQTIHPDTKPKPFSEILSDPDFVAAREANERGDGAAALKLLNALAQRYPKEPRLLFQSAYAYENLGLYDEAYRSWRAYIDIDPADPYAWRHFAIAAANLNRINEAINAYKQTLKIKPDAETWRLLGDLYDAQGQHALGVHAHDEAKKLESEKKRTGASPTAGTSPAGPQLPEGTAPESRNGFLRNGRTWQAWIGEFVKQFVQANQLKDVDANLVFYAPNVDYFDDHQKDQAYIRADIGTYNERWPVRHDSIEGDIHLEEKAADQRYTASFRLNFYAESAARAQWSNGQFAIDLDISIVDGVPRISGIKEKILRHQKGNLKAVAPTNAASARSQSSVGTSHQESNLSSRLAFAPQPSYPSEARQKRLTGSGRFRISFDAEGKAMSVSIVRSTGHSVLDMNTISALKRWRAIAGTPFTIVVPIAYAKP